MKSIILFCKVIDINISIARCSNIDTICLLRKDHKTNVVLKVYGAMTIMRFIHASEYSPYHIYPLYPIERARVDGAMETLLLKVAQSSSNQFLNLIETQMLDFSYISLSEPRKNPIDVKLKGEDPEPTLADILAFYLVKEFKEDSKIVEFQKLYAWHQSIKNEWEDSIHELTMELNGLSPNQRLLNEIVIDLQNKVYVEAKL